MTDTIERYRGSLLGLAVGDALGTTLEFKAPGTFAPICDIVVGGPFGLEPGQWTDDTSMALSGRALSPGAVAKAGCGGVLPAAASRSESPPWPGQCRKGEPYSPFRRRSC